MKLWILGPVAALVTVAGLAGQAAEPWNNQASNQALRASATRATGARTPVFPTAHAWVNSMRQETATPARPPAITGNTIGMGSAAREAGDAAVGNGAVISQSAWNHEHQYTGYVYGPGSCDSTPPCVDHLWDGYCQRPHRCGGHHHGRHFRGGCGFAVQGCSSCGTSADVGCASGCDSGCGVAMKCHGCKLHAFKQRFASNCDSCATSCDTCGHGHKLFSGKHRGWFASLCDSCDGGMSCGCAASIGDGPKGETVPTPAIDMPGEAPAPMPTVDDAKSARRNTINRYIPWSFK